MVNEAFQNACLRRMSDLSAGIRKKYSSVQEMLTSFESPIYSSKNLASSAADLIFKVVLVIALNSEASAPVKIWGSLALDGYDNQLNKSTHWKIYEYL